MNKKTLLKSLLLAAGLLVLSACTREEASIAKPESPFQPTATIQEIMHSIIDTNADDVWNSVATINTASGTEERSPQTDEEWQAVRRHAITLAEASNLLLIEGRRVAAEGADTSSVEAELSADEIQKSIAAHRPEFIAHAHALHDATLQAVAAIDAKNAEELVRVGAVIDHACESCHARFWYPNEKIPAFPRLEKKPPDKNI